MEKRKMSSSQTQTQTHILDRQTLELELRDMIQRQKELESEIKLTRRRLAQRIREEYPFVYTIEVTIMGRQNHTKCIGCFGTLEDAERCRFPDTRGQTSRVISKESCEMTDDRMLDIQTF
ncbi:unnamed protein product [marine sediment metagenome]|uniref:Uncharacterized protein n=1 Tax=marine sediment metagenome TaxID=412755 RepID=X0RZ52_9ZZZZ